MVRGSQPSADAQWPSLPIAEWAETQYTLHRFTQILGKVRMALTPLVNHWWNVTLYVTPRGLTTSTMYDGSRAVQVDLDLREHALRVHTSDGRSHGFSMPGLSVADFYGATMEALRSVGVEVRIGTLPQEVPDPVPFEDDLHDVYQREHVSRFFRLLLQADRVLQTYRSQFVGKCSPVHFFWGSFDLACTRFSGREAPPHPGVPGVADIITREGYSHECHSVGMWPGGGDVSEPAFYAYAYPEPDGFRGAGRVEPPAAFYSSELQEWLLPYEALRSARDPDAALLAFCRSTYELAADLGDWPRRVLERR